jgi:acyl-CoA thioester hydrolase
MKPLQIQIRFSDIDMMGHVNNAVYLNYFEQARLIFFNETLGLDWDWDRQGFVLRKNEIEYIKPLLLNDKPEIFISLLHVGNKSFTLGYKVVCQGEIYTKGSSVIVGFNSVEKISIPLPEAILVGIERLKKA